MRSAGRSSLGAGLAACLLGVTLSPTSAMVPDEPAAGRHGDAAAARSVVRVAVAGDIACPPNGYGSGRCHDAATARLITSRRVKAVLTLGDQQYNSGLLRDFRRSYARTWGAFKAKTFPVPGNHEYESGGRGYFRYFGRRAHGPRGWYAVNLGGWRIYALNTNCDHVDCAAERRWLRRDLRSYPRRCSLATMHEPRFSSGRHGDSANAARFFRLLDGRGVDLVLAGHDHDYERFASMHSSGALSKQGLRSFVAGTGGRELRPFGHDVHRGSRARVESRYGVLFLRLASRSYSWGFRTVGGRVRDRGSARCVA